MDARMTILKGRRMGTFKHCKYPNLIEIYDYFPTSYFANVTDDLMLAVFLGEEDLTEGEMRNIAHYNRIPVSVLTCPKLITLNRDRKRHCQLIRKLNDKLGKIEEFQKAGCKSANDYLLTYCKIYLDDYLSMVLNFREGKLITYGHYLGVNKQMDNTILSCRCELQPKPRDVKRP